MTRDVDIAIVGSGFSGALLAMIARRLGRSVVLLERGRHPRFAIGESSTPLASLLLEDLARRYDLPRLIPFAKYGTWKREYPDVACGLKRGFSFFRHDAGARFATDESHGNQLLVAASPNDDIGDVHWYRPDLDHFLVREAVSLGVEYFDETDITEFTPHSAGVARLTGERRRAVGGTEQIEITARLVVDATGPRGFLHRQLSLAERPLPGMPATQALYTHFTGVRVFGEVTPMLNGVPPYPVDAAAVHHLFDGGWIWVLRFDNGITSAGVAATETLARELQLSDGAPAWSRLLNRFPSIDEQFSVSTATRDFTWLPKLSFASSALAGDGWVMLPSAAGVVDPLLSTGFPLTLLGVERIAAAIAADWGTPRLPAALDRYATQTQSELDVTSRLVGALYASFDDFERFTALSFLYFAAASFAESARRLGKADVAGDAFMLAGHPSFGPALAQCLDLTEVPTGRAKLLSAIAAAIEPVNVAGLADPARRNWYPCLAADLLASAKKLGATEREVLAMLERCGFTPRAVAG